MSPAPNPNNDNKSLVSVTYNFEAMRQPENKAKLCFDMNMDGETVPVDHRAFNMDTMEQFRAAAGLTVLCAGMRLEVAPQRLQQIKRAYAKHAKRHEM